MSQIELSEYKTLENANKAMIDDEIERLQASLPFYFFSVKYNYLLFFLHLADRKNRRESGSIIPKYTYSDDEFGVMIDGSDTFFFSYTDKKWYFTSSKYPSAERVEIVDETYIESLKKSLRRMYGLKFLCPRVFA